MTSLADETKVMKEHLEGLENQALPFAKVVQQKQGTKSEAPQIISTAKEEMEYAQACWKDEGIDFGESYIKPFAGCMDVIAQLFSEDESLEGIAIEKIRTLSDQEIRFLLLQLNALAPAGWAKSLDRKISNPELLTASASFVLRGSVLRQMWDIISSKSFNKNDRVISMFLVHASQLGGLSYAQKALWYKDNDTEDGYLHTKVAEALIEEGVGPYLSQDQNYSQSFNRQKPDPYKVPKAPLDAEDALTELEAFLRPSNLVISPFDELKRLIDENGIEVIWPDADFSQQSTKAWELVFLSKKIVAEYHAFGDEPIAKKDNPEFVKNLQMLIARLTQFTGNWANNSSFFEPALESLREINNRITACGVLKQSEEYLKESRDRPLPRTKASDVKPLIGIINSKDIAKPDKEEIAKEIAAIEALLDHASVLIMGNGYGLYSSSEDPRSMAFDALDEALRHYDGFICWNNTEEGRNYIFEVHQGRRSITLLAETHPCYSEIVFPSIESFRITTAEEYSNITGLNPKLTPTTHVSRAVELGMERDRSYALICHEGVNRSQTSYDVASLLAPIDAYWTLMVQGAESGYFPYQAFANLDEDTLYRYIHGKIMSIKEDGEWIYNVFHTSLGALKSIREGGQVFRDTLNPDLSKQYSANPSAYKQLELARQLAHALHHESLRYMVRNALEGRKESLVLFMRASSIIGASLHEAAQAVLDEIREDAEDKGATPADINALLEAKKSILRENLRVVCCFTGDSISRSGGIDEQHAFRADYTRTAQDKPLSTYLPDTDEYSREFLSSLRHQYYHSEEYPNLFFMNNDFIAHVHQSYEHSKEISLALPPKENIKLQNLVRHTEASLRKALHYWADIEGRLNVLGPNALHRAFRNQVVNQHFYSKITLLEQLIDVFTEDQCNKLFPLLAEAKMTVDAFNQSTAKKSDAKLIKIEASLSLNRTAIKTELAEEFRSETMMREAYHRLFSMTRDYTSATLEALKNLSDHYNILASEHGIKDMLKRKYMEFKACVDKSILLQLRKNYAYLETIKKHINEKPLEWSCNTLVTSWLEVVALRKQAILMKDSKEKTDFVLNCDYLINDFKKWWKDRCKNYGQNVFKDGVTVEELMVHQSDFQVISKIQEYLDPTDRANYQDLLQYCTCMILSAHTTTEEVEEQKSSSPVEPEQLQSTASTNVLIPPVQDAHTTTEAVEEQKSASPVESVQPESTKPTVQPVDAIKQVFTEWANNPATKNSTLIKKIQALLGAVDNSHKTQAKSTFRGLSAESMDPVDKPRGVGLTTNCQQTQENELYFTQNMHTLIHYAKTRQNRTLSKISFFGAGRDTKIVQPLYDMLAGVEPSITAEEFHAKIEKIAKNAHPLIASSTLPYDGMLVLLKKFMNFFDNNKEFSRHTGINKMCAVIKRDASDDDKQIVFSNLRKIALERQNNTWSKLSVFHQGRDTKWVQPLYDLMADPNFGNNQQSMERLQDILDGVKGVSRISIL